MEDDVGDGRLPASGGLLAVWQENRFQSTNRRWPISSRRGFMLPCIFAGCLARDNEGEEVTSRS